jgi:hypothetical protein
MWVTGPLLSSEMEGFDSRLYKAINGDDGGTWAPTDKIILGGAGLKCTVLTELADVTASGDVTVQGETDLQDDVAVGGDLDVAGALEVLGLTSLRDDTTVDADLQVNETLTVLGASDLQGALDVGGAMEVLGTTSLRDDVVIDAELQVNEAVVLGDTLSVAGAMQVGGALTLLGAVGINQPVTPTGSGRVRAKSVLGADANTTYSAGTAQRVHVTGLTSTTRTYTIDTTGASDGDTINFSTTMVSKLIVLDVQGGNPQTLSLQSALTNGYNWVELTYISGGWHVTAGVIN